MSQFPLVSSKNPVVPSSRSGTGMPQGNSASRDVRDRDASWSSVWNDYHKKDDKSDRKADKKTEGSAARNHPGSNLKEEKSGDHRSESSGKNGLTGKTERAGSLADMLAGSGMSGSGKSPHGKGVSGTGNLRADPDGGPGRTGDQPHSEKGLFPRSGARTGLGINASLKSEMFRSASQLQAMTDATDAQNDAFAAQGAEGGNGKSGPVLAGSEGNAADLKAEGSGKGAGNSGNAVKLSDNSGRLADPDKQLAGQAGMNRTDGGEAETSGQSKNATGPDVSVNRGDSDNPANAADSNSDSENKSGGNARGGILSGMNLTGNHEMTAGGTLKEGEEGRLSAANGRNGNAEHRDLTNTTRAGWSFNSLTRALAQKLQAAQKGAGQVEHSAQVTDMKGTGLQSTGSEEGSMQSGETLQGTANAEQHPESSGKGEAKASVWEQKFKALFRGEDGSRSIHQKNRHANHISTLSQGAEQSGASRLPFQGSAFSSEPTFLSSGTVASPESMSSVKPEIAGGYASSDSQNSADLDWKKLLMEIELEKEQEEERKEVNASLARIGQSHLMNADLRREIMPGITKMVQHAQESGKSRDGSWQNHRFQLDDGKNLRISAREVDGVLQLKMGSSNSELSRMLQQHFQEIREHLEKECDISIELQLDGGGADNFARFFGDPDQSAQSGQLKFDDEEAAEPMAIKNVAPQAVRDFGYNQMEWTI